MTEYLPAREVIFVLPESHTDFVLSVDRGGRGRAWPGAGDRSLVRDLDFFTDQARGR
jgi:hypothetical protein